MACAAARSPADQDRFICIYPAYLNNKKTIAEGRRIPINKAVENPTATEIQDVCLAVGLNAFLEKNKLYSREWNRDVQYRGRVRVQLKQEDGSLCLVQFPSRINFPLEDEDSIFLPSHIPHVCILPIFPSCRYIS
ncbi:signal recognition particle 19 kDa protein isoform X1 [Loxodonta africana]|uniref:signal recognition particle 19 kDa protein isoform X1 n=1 Tax=Loxodonta africana TaxID=9785 RepID=UPI00054042BE|nr:signal recognition particle 19 kDa protein isoform X1 [Loxodonta africana]XP_049728276.1 signal recognition particle 19 kDa protein isoform X1 [Elephas maximus indicus]